MVIDTSAVVAILFGEDEGPRFAEAIEDASVRLISAVTRVEMSLVVEGRKGTTGRAVLDRFLAGAELEVVPVTTQQAMIAIEAFRQYGKGRHAAALNIGDCFVYALAKATGLAVLFKGRDFALTDIAGVMPG